MSEQKLQTGSKLVNADGIYYQEDGQLKRHNVTTNTWDVVDGYRLSLVADETEVKKAPQSYATYAKDHMRFAEFDISAVIAHVMRWQNQNSTALPLEVKYWQEGNVHYVEFEFIWPYEE